MGRSTKLRSTQPFSRVGEVSINNKGIRIPSPRKTFKNTIKSSAISPNRSPNRSPQKSPFVSPTKLKRGALDLTGVQNPMDDDNEED